MSDNVDTFLAVTIAAASAAVAVALVAPTNAYAESMAGCTTPFVGIGSRAEVQAELMGRSELLGAEGPARQARRPHIAEVRP